MANPSESKQRPRTTTPRQTETVIEPEGGVQYFYANIYQVTWTMVDVKIRFAELTKIDLNGHNTITERAVVTMAWAEAKSLLETLETSIASYEKVNGKIKIPPELRLPPGILPTSD